MYIGKVILRSLNTNYNINITLILPCVVLSVLMDHKINAPARKLIKGTQRLKVLVLVFQNIQAFSLNFKAFKSFLGLIKYAFEIFKQRRQFLLKL